ncbi:hypothetical protein [Azospirillum sp. B510]|uniref:hypothetical protein n=1 Tax=Azospirillum sp. (strain B510) TaxID=137722 RepID=UPI0005AAE9C5|nr:hypothetical protein [Azospirillum sp. B510]
MRATNRFSRLKTCAFLAGALTIGTAGAAQAATVQFQIVNNYGATITLDSASCTSGSISAPFSISNGATASFIGSTTDPSTLCTVRYQQGANGCQFQVQVSSVGGFASTNAYKGAAGRPRCDQSGPGIPGSSSYTGQFVMR